MVMFDVVYLVTIKAKVIYHGALQLRTSTKLTVQSGKLTDPNFAIPNNYQM